MLHGYGFWAPDQPQAFAIERASIIYCTIEQALRRVDDDLEAARKSTGRGKHLNGRLVADVSQAPAMAMPLIMRGVLPYTVVHGPRSPMQFQLDTTSSVQVGAGWLVSRGDDLIASERPTQRHAWPFVPNRIAVSTERLSEDADGGELSRGAFKEALNATESLIHRPGADDAALALQTPVEAVSLALLLTVADMALVTPWGPWERPKAIPL
jgi:hypothetical protein